MEKEKKPGFIQKMKNIFFRKKPAKLQESDLQSAQQEEKNPFQENRLKIGKSMQEKSNSAGEKILTDFDSIESFIESKGSTNAAEISRALGIPKKRIMNCALVLEKAGLIDVKYPAFGSPKIVFLNKNENGNPEYGNKKIAEISSKKLTEKKQEIKKKKKGGLFG
ncbi:MAG: hypothetical protein ABIA76_04905 [Candidatus Diapherotrites archaeon]